MALRVLFAVVMLGYAAAMVVHLVRSERVWRQQKAEWDEGTRINNLPDDEFVAWYRSQRP